MITDFEQQLLHNSATWDSIVSSLPPITPSMDEKLRSDLDLYGSFVYHLCDAGMIGFTDQPLDLVTPFFVEKKDGLGACGSSGLVVRVTAVLGRVAPRICRPAHRGRRSGLLLVKNYISPSLTSRTISVHLESQKGLDVFSVCHLFVWTPFWLIAKLLWKRMVCVGLFLRVVPMGWNWAVYFGQRAHVHLALKFSGLDESRLISDQTPTPHLGDSTPVLLTYCDNLNVASICPQSADSCKDRIVAAMRVAVFIIYEETPTQVRCRSLGYDIDGELGLEQLSAEKRAKLIGAFTWLSRRPRVSGQVVGVSAGTRRTCAAAAPRVVVDVSIPV